MRCISTEPTMPRQPTSPTLLISIHRSMFVHRLTDSRMQRRHDRFTHLFGADFLHARLVNVAGAQALLKHPLHRGLDARGAASSSNV